MSELHGYEEKKMGINSSSSIVDLLWSFWVHRFLPYITSPVFCQRFPHLKKIKKRVINMLNISYHIIYSMVRIICYDKMWCKTLIVCIYYEKIAIPAMGHMKPAHTFPQIIHTVYYAFRRNGCLFV